MELNNLDELQPLLAKDSQERSGVNNNDEVLTRKVAQYVSAEKVGS